MSWKLILTELTCQLMAHVMYLGDGKTFFPFPLEFAEETPIWVRMTPKWRPYTQGSLTWEETTKAQTSEAQGSAITKTKIEERFLFL